MDRANIPQNNILNAIIKTATICNRCIVPTKKFTLILILTLYLNY